MRSRIAALSIAGLSVATSLACSGGSDTETDGVTLTIVAYESFTPLEGIFDDFTNDTGIAVRVIAAGDTGEMLAKAALTAGNPEGDVMWGVDNTLLGRAIEADVFDPYVSRVDGLSSELVATAADTVTPVDYGDVCVNYDIERLETLGIEPPNSFADLTEPEYRGLLVTPSALTSSTGLAFLLGSIVADPENWRDTWRDLRDNDLLVVDGWYEAYYTAFSRYGGDRPLVVSYASSPPAEVLYADPPLPEGAPAPTAVVTATCFRQIEYVGVLRGSRHVTEARTLIDFLVSTTFQETMPESLFVFPANERAALPRTFAAHVQPVTSPLVMDPDTIASSRDGWLEEWDEIVG
ncbi:MAG: thiamine ABC transporter substrate-binding protein [Actinobacteria bacterium]|nr:thiamine ABC transporter substrate-binding protein [Actinomycetota bacterium]